VSHEVWVEHRNRSVAARAVLNVLRRGVFCCEPQGISAYFAFASNKARGGLNAVVDNSGGARESRVADPLAERLAVDLGDQVCAG
jgi:hypothetical protein